MLVHQILLVMQLHTHLICQRDLDLFQNHRNIEQFTKQFDCHISLSAYGPLAICKLQVYGLDQKTTKCLIKDPFQNIL